MAPSDKGKDKPTKLLPKECPFTKVLPQKLTKLVPKSKRDCQSKSAGEDCIHGIDVVGASDRQPEDNPGQHLRNEHTTNISPVQSDNDIRRAMDGASYKCRGRSLTRRNRDISRKEVRRSVRSSSSSSLSSSSSSSSSPSPRNERGSKQGSLPGHRDRKQGRGHRRGSPSLRRSPRIEEKPKRSTSRSHHERVDSHSKRHRSISSSSWSSSTSRKRSRSTRSNRDKRHKHRRRSASSGSCSSSSTTTSRHCNRPSTESPRGRRQSTESPHVRRSSTETSRGHRPSTETSRGRRSSTETSRGCRSSTESPRGNRDRKQGRGHRRESPSLRRSPRIEEKTKHRRYEATPLHKKTKNSHSPESQSSSSFTPSSASSIDPVYLLSIAKAKHNVYKDILDTHNHIMKRNHKKRKSHEFR